MCSPQDVLPNSPAAKAGLVAHEDYLLGTQDFVLKNYSDLELLLSRHEGQTITVCVFNALSRTIRDVRNDCLK